MSLQAHKTATLSGLAGKGAVPDDGQLAGINRWTVEPLGAEQVYSRTAYLAHNGIDRDREAFDRALLADFARTLPGKGLFVKHPGGWDGDSGPGVGRWYAAQVVEMGLDEARAALREPGLQWPPGTERAALLEASFYLPRTGKNADLTADIDAGIAGDVSIGFRAADRAGITDANGTHIASRLLGPGEALEGSLVWLGAQPGARVTKAAGGGTDDDEGTAMKLTDEQIATLQKQHETAAAQVKALEPKAARLDAIVAALPDAAKSLVETPEVLAARIADGDGYRATLVEETVAAKRVLGLVPGDDEATIAAAKNFYAAMPIALLKAEHQVMSKAGAAGGAPLGGGDPNAGKGQQSAQQKAAEGSPLANPLITGAAA